MGDRVDVNEVLKAKLAKENEEQELDGLKAVVRVDRSTEYKQVNEDAYNLDEEKDPLLNVFSFGWMEDGRLGYAAEGSFVQDSPRPIVSLRPPSYDVKRNVVAKKEKEIKNAKLMPSSKDLRKNLRKSSVSQMTASLRNEGNNENIIEEAKKVEEKIYYKQFICQKVSAGYRHTLFLLINCRGCEEPNERVSRTKKLFITGLNQRGLCEEPGYSQPMEIPWPEDEDPIDICAGDGTSFIVSKFGNCYSFGHGRYGVLGHGDELSMQAPRQILGLNRHRIKRVAAGAHHTLAISYAGKIFSWGKNDKGQLGLGVESNIVLEPVLIESFGSNNYIFDISCGREFSVCVAAITTKSGDEKTTVYAWGDGSRGQLGSGDLIDRMKPQENRWLTKLLKSSKLTISSIKAGGWHVLALTNYSGQVISWGAGDYGQLGHGFLWDDSQPKIVNAVKYCEAISAGARHSCAIMNTRGVYDLMSWGYNGYGELGLGDINVRSQPTRSNPFAKATRLTDLSCGDRHTVVITTHIPIVARQDPNLRQYYEVLEETNYNPSIYKQLKKLMQRKGLDSDLLDSPNAPIANQAGVTDAVLTIDLYERGLRYCLDTKQDPDDWRHKTYEVCYNTYIDGHHFPSVCLACARHCLSGATLRPYVKLRKKGDICQCRGTKYCVCSYSRVRAEFDKFVGVEIIDICIGPNQIRKLLQNLRNPIPITRDEIDDCLVTLADGIETTQLPRIHPVRFEKWYREYFNEYEEDG